MILWICVVFALEIGLKFIFGRCNPDGWYKNDCGQITDKYEFSWFNPYLMGFPSGHCSVVGFCLLWLNYIWPHALYFSLVTIAALVSCLVISGHHFLADCLAGLALGLILGMVSHIMWNKIHAKVILNEHR